MNLFKAFLPIGIAAGALLSSGCDSAAGDSVQSGSDGAFTTGQALITEGQNTFRYETFGDEDFWGGQLRLHEAVRGQALGGVGSGLSPSTALTLGLKVDADALLAATRSAIANGTADLSSPLTTIELLRQNAVVGMRGIFDAGGSLSSIGITCALCHSTVDDSLAGGIGSRRDGWANRDLDVGAVIGLAPDLSAYTTLLGVTDAEVRTVLASWGPGKFDAELLLDGKAFQPSGASSATLIPPAFGLAGVNLATWTGWGSITHWNAFVAVLEMHGKGNFYDPRLNDAVKFPIAAANNFGDVRHTPDLVTPKLAALQYYQLSLAAPKAASGSFDPVAANAGEVLFTGVAGCNRCHVAPHFTEAGWNMHTGAEIGIDDFQAQRSPDGRYRTAPLKGLWTHQKGGFYHDGRFASLLDVVDHYDVAFGLFLTANDKLALVEYLKSL